MFGLRIIWQRADGGVTVTTPCEPFRHDQETITEYMERVAALRIKHRGLPTDSPRRFIPATDLPASRRLREAWEWDDGPTGLRVNVEKGRAIVLAELRDERNRRLDASDRDWTRASEIGTPQEIQALRRYRQALRDMPNVEGPKIETMTVAELEAYQPNWPTL